MLAFFLLYTLHFCSVNGRSGVTLRDFRFEFMDKKMDNVSEANGSRVHFRDRTSNRRSVRSIMKQPEFTVNELCR